MANFYFASNKRNCMWKPQRTGTGFLIYRSDVFAPFLRDWYSRKLSSLLSYTCITNIIPVCCLTDLTVFQPELFRNSQFRLGRIFKAKMGDSNHSLGNTGLGLSFHSPVVQSVPSLDVEDMKINKLSPSLQELTVKWGI